MMNPWYCDWHFVASIRNIPNKSKVKWLQWQKRPRIQAKATFPELLCQTGPFSPSVLKVHRIPNRPIRRAWLDLSEHSGWPEYLGHHWVKCSVEIGPGLPAENQIPAWRPCKIDAFPGPDLVRKFGHCSLDRRSKSGAWTKLGELRFCVYRVPCT